jgi:hypothetical protein
MAVQVTRRRFTVDEYHRMAEAGILSEDSRVELLDGEIVEMAPIGGRHAATVRRLNTLFAPAAAAGVVIVDVQDPIRLGSYSEPQPDIMLLPRRPDLLAPSIPGPGDALLVVEVVDSTAAYDRTVKLPLYAQAGVAVVWLVDLQKNVVEVYESPEDDAYQNVRVARAGDTLPIRGVPDLSISVEAVLGV